MEVWMSSKKELPVEKWDRMKGRRTIYFSQAEISMLEHLSADAESSEQDVVKGLVKDFSRGLLVRKEALDAYRNIVETFAKSSRGSGEIPVFGSEEEGGEERNQKAG